MSLLKSPSVKLRVREKEGICCQTLSFNRAVVLGLPPKFTHWQQCATLRKNYSHTKTKQNRCWRDGSVVKNAGCSCRVPGFVSFPAPIRRLQLSVTSEPEGLFCSSWCTDTQAGKISVYISFLKFILKIKQQEIQTWATENNKLLHYSIHYKYEDKQDSVLASTGSKSGMMSQWTT